MFRVEFYKDKNGNSDIIDLLDELKEKGKTSKTDRVNRIKILAYIQALQTNGTRIGFPVVKHIDGDIWELRPIDNRIFFFHWKDGTIVLLHHFVKKSQKTPLKEIEQARIKQKDFLKRKSEQNEK